MPKISNRQLSMEISSKETKKSTEVRGDTSGGDEGGRSVNEERKTSAEFLEHLKKFRCHAFSEDGTLLAAVYHTERNQNSTL